MKKIILCSDSTNDLTVDLISQHDIKIVPLMVEFANKVYKDGEDINVDMLYELVKQHGELPKTAAVSPAVFIEFFMRYVNEDTEIIYTGIGSDLSSSFQNAYLATQAIDEKLAKNIYLVDSKNLSTGIGLLLLKMADMRKDGLTAKEIKENADKIVPKVRAQFSVKHLDFLHKGGRCSGTAKFFGTMLRIRPILRVIDGKIILNDKAYGKYEKALDILVDDICRNIDNVDDSYMFITHTHGFYECEYIQKHLPPHVINKFKHIYVSEAGCVISSHCGERTIGILYIKDSKVTE